jgi:hypothetical protein
VRRRTLRTIEVVAMRHIGDKRLETLKKWLEWIPEHQDESPEEG